jgi:hypothetical protein
MRFISLVMFKLIYGAQAVTEANNAGRNELNCDDGYSFLTRGTE